MGDDGLDLSIAATLGACAGTAYVCTVCEGTFDHRRDAQRHGLQAHGDVTTVRQQEDGS